MRELAVFGVLTGAALLSGCANQEIRASAIRQPPAVVARVITVAAAPFQAALPITGTLVSRAHVEVKAEIAGRIMRFDKEEGARISAGEPVVWVNDENYRLALRQAETAVRVAEAGVERAELLKSHSQAELERAQKLLRSGGITEKDLKSARLAERDAGAQVELARAQLEQAGAALEFARKHVRDTIIRSPVSGEIERKLANPGAYVEASTPVFTIVDNSRLELESPVASAELSGIRPGQRVVFTVNSYAVAEFEGRVIDVAPAVDEQTRSAKVRIHVVNGGGKLKAGMFAQGEILMGLNEASIVIPGGAVYREDRAAKSSYVFVLENGKAARRDIRIGREREDRLEISGGLRPGDRLIAEQNIQIAEGVRIDARR